MQSIKVQHASRPVAGRFAALAALLAVPALATFVQAAPPTLSASAIVEKNAAARGGLPAWRAVKTLTFSGKMDAGRIRPDGIGVSFDDPRLPKKKKHVPAPDAAPKDSGTLVQLPFVMELKRPLMSRVEVKFQGDTAVQVFNGSEGWKLRPYLGRKEWEAFTAEEAKIAADQQQLDGPLIDYAQKGSKVALEGVDRVEGRDAYKLKVTLKNGDVRRVWVDAESFLDVKIDGTRRIDGKQRPMYTIARDFRTVEGLKIPYELETSVETVKNSERILVERVVVNPPLEDALFNKPSS
jgi:hypothetical protein